MHGFKNFLKKVVENKFNIAVVVLCSFVVSCLVIKVYWIAYTKPRLQHEKPLRPTYDLSNFELVDLLILIIVGIIVGVSITDVKKMLYGYIGAMLLAYTISAAFFFYHTWFLKGFQIGLSPVPYGWEWALFAAILDAFVLMVPWVVCLFLIGMIMGVFIRVWVLPFRLYD
jgi:hypothetical protein